MNSNDRFNELDYKICRVVRMIINWSRLLRGYTLVNKQGHTVKLVRFKQVWSNPKRKKPYKLDHFSWQLNTNLYKEP